MSNKNDVIRLRIDTETKTHFNRICKARGETASEVLTAYILKVISDDKKKHDSKQ
jgi:antitoxin component of RelBE/YafQ-DinJ toxin-antitoxin module